MMAADLDSLDLAEMLQEERRQLSWIVEDMTALYKENSKLVTKIRNLNEELEEFCIENQTNSYDDSRDEDFGDFPEVKECLAREGGCPAWPTSGTDTPLVPGCLFPSAAASPPWLSRASPAVGSRDSVLVSTTSQIQVEDRQVQADREALAMDTSEDATAIIEIVEERRK